MYEFRYTDANKKRRSIYDMDLMKLRAKEDKIKLMRHEGIDYAGGGITVSQLLERYISLKRGVRYSTIASIRGVVKPAFQMAYTEDIIRRNPFEFRLDIIPNNTQKRVALTPKQQEQFLEYIRNDAHFCRYLDEIKILLGTGMRISEFCGLPISDLDFERRRIRVDHQLVRTQDGKRYIEKTKTECGCRYIPMSDEVYESFYNILSNRKKQKKEVMIDGYAGFILLDKNGNPKVGMDLKSLQYLMGHSDASVTLNVCTHNSYEKAEESMAQIVSFSGRTKEETQARRFG